MMRLASFAVAICLALLMAAPVSAEVYIAGTDFSSTDNPNGVWSYGYRDSSASTDFTAFTVSGDYPLDAGIGAWYKGWFRDTADPIVPYVAQNTNAVSHSLPTTVPVIQPGQLVMHPGKTNFI